MAGTGLNILFNIISETTDISQSRWYIFCYIIVNLGLLYTLISIVGYYYQNYSIIEMFRHPLDAVIAISLFIYFIVLLIALIFTHKVMPFTHT